MVEKIELERRGDEGGVCLTWMELENGSIRVERFDHGPATQRILGGDYERTIVIVPENVTRLCFRLLAETLKNRLEACDEVAELCKHLKIEYEDRSWS
jgi:hypothetical protein